MIDIRLCAHSLWRDVRAIHSDFLSLERVWKSMGRQLEGLTHVSQSGDGTFKRAPGSSVREGSLS